MGYAGVPSVQGYASACLQYEVGRPVAPSVGGFSWCGGVFSARGYALGAGVYTGVSLVQGFMPACLRCRGVHHRPSM